MAAAKVLAFLRSGKPGALALTGPTGCGKRHAIAEAARQVGVAITLHDLAQGKIEWGRLGSQQLAHGLRPRDLQRFRAVHEGFGICEKDTGEDNSGGR